MNATEWGTLVNAMPDCFLVEALTLSDIGLDFSTGKLLFQALAKMPALSELALQGIRVENALLFDLLSCPRLAALKTLGVATKGDASVYPLLLKTLQACELQGLSIEEAEKTNALTADQHQRLAKALNQHTGLNSLRLRIESCGKPEQFECYAEFLRGNSSIVALDLSQSQIGRSNCNLLLEALRNKPHLHLSLRDCGLQRIPGPDLRTQIAPLADMRGLRELDFSGNYLGVDTTAALLFTMEQSEACLWTLNLDEHMSGSVAVAAMASLLKNNRTLISVSFRPAYDAYDDGAVKLLAEAMKHNTSLLRFDIRIHRNSVGGPQHHPWSSISTATIGLWRLLACRPASTWVCRWT